MGAKMAWYECETTEDLAAVDLDEKALKDRAEPAQRVLTAGTLIFSLAFCTLVFWAGWKEASLFEKCSSTNEVRCSGPGTGNIGKLRTTLTGTPADQSPRL
jgi:hypothetical protein